MNQEKIDRINALARKSRAEGLTEAEKAEQFELRQEYIAAIRKNLRGQLENIDIVEKDGSITSVKERHDQRMKEDEYHTVSSSEKK